VRALAALPGPAVALPPEPQPELPPGLDPLEAEKP
jgi:hypothetical protein